MLVNYMPYDILVKEEKKKRGERCNTERRVGAHSRRCWHVVYTYRIYLGALAKERGRASFGVQPRQSVAHWHQSLSGIHCELPR